MRVAMQGVNGCFGSQLLRNKVIQIVIEGLHICSPVRHCCKHILEHLFEWVMCVFFVDKLWQVFKGTPSIPSGNVDPSHSFTCNLVINRDQLTAHSAIIKNRPRRRSSIANCFLVSRDHPPAGGGEFYHARAFYFRLPLEAAPTTTTMALQTREQVASTCFDCK